MIGLEQAPTRAAVLELQQERTLVAEAYEFLDEKRLLLAAELLRQLDAYRRLRTQLDALAGEARRGLVAAVERHGLQGLGVYPPASLDGTRLERSQRDFMGVALLATGLTLPASPQAAAPSPSNPSSEAAHCGALFTELLVLSAELAGVSGNLHRLLEEYRLSERRARALENVILPEIEQSLRTMTNYLEEMELEDAIRARWHLNGRRG